jgi:hypothetical protein
LDAAESATEERETASEARFFLANDAGNSLTRPCAAYTDDYSIAEIM